MSPPNTYDYDLNEVVRAHQAYHDTLTETALHYDALVTKLRGIPVTASFFVPPTARELRAAMRAACSPLVVMEGAAVIVGVAWASITYLGSGAAFLVSTILLVSGILWLTGTVYREATTAQISLFDGQGTFRIAGHDCKSLEELLQRHPVRYSSIVQSVMEAAFQYRDQIDQRHSKARAILEAVLGQDSAQKELDTFANERIRSAYKGRNVANE